MKRIATGLIVALALAVPTSVVLANEVDQDVLDEGKALFQSKATPACAICHTLQDADATGTIGPDLDELKADMDRIKQVMMEGMGAMPSFADTLSDEQRDAVAAYVLHATGVQ